MKEVNINRSIVVDLDWLEGELKQLEEGKAVRFKGQDVPIIDATISTIKDI